MDNPRPEKVAVVGEVRERLEGASASLVTEYRGLTVADLAELRRSLNAAGSDYKIFKNTLVRLAIDGSPHAPLQELLTGPTAIAFVHGDVSAVAKALRDFSRANAHLVVKGGLLDGSLLSPSQLGSLADLPHKDVLLARMAGAISAPLTQLAGLIEALPRNLAYGLKALLDQKGGAPATPEAETPAPETAVPVEAEPAVPETAAPAVDAPTPAPEAEIPVPEAEAPAPEAEAGSAEVGSAEPAGEAGEASAEAAE